MTTQTANQTTDIEALISTIADQEDAAKLASKLLAGQLTSRDAYLAFRAEWRAWLKRTEEEIRQAKRVYQNPQERDDARGDAQNRRRWLRHRAHAALMLRTELKRLRREAAARGQAA